MVHYQPVDLSGTKNVNVSHEKPLQELFKLSVGLAAIVLAAIIVLSALAEVLILILPAQLDEQLGHMLAESSAKDHTEIPIDSDIQAVFDNLSAQQPAPHPKYTLHVIEDPDTINAMAAPGGHIYLFSGLLDRLESDDALAFVLGHEMGHVQHRHALKSVGRTVVIATAAGIFLPNDNFIGQALQSLVSLEQLQHSRQQEMDADRFGMNILTKAGYSPQKSLQFFNALKANPNSKRYTISVFSTHPADAERMEALAQYTP